MANAPTPDDIGRVYRLHGRRVVLINDRGVAVASSDPDVTVKAVDPTNGEYPVVTVDYGKLTSTDEWLGLPTSDLQVWARAELTNTELAEWVGQAHAPAPAGSGLPRGADRLEIVRLLREQSYVVLRVHRQPVWAEWDPIVRARAEAVLDTPIDELAAMVTMSDTVMGNWRTIAATLVPA